MNFKSITAKAWLFTACFACILIIQFSTTYLNNKHLAQELDHLSDTKLQLVYKAYSLKEATTQVQQWLTDISATRAQDGLNDGFDVAAEYYQLFNKTIGELKDLDTANAARYDALTPVFDR